MIKAFAAASFAAMAPMAFAQAPGAQPGHVQSTAVPAADPNEVVCQKLEVTGSRLSQKRICKTRAQWADQQLQDRQEIEKVQVQRGMKGE